MDKNPVAPTPTSSCGSTQTLRDMYLDLRPQIKTINPIRTAGHRLRRQRRDGLDGVVFSARFPLAERRPEAALQDRRRDQLHPRGRPPGQRGQGQGGLLSHEDLVLAGAGLAADHAAHAEPRSFSAARFISLDLVGPHYYRLDTALAVPVERPRPTRRSRTPPTSPARAPSCAAYRTRWRPRSATPSPSASTPISERPEHHAHQARRPRHSDDEHGYHQLLWTPASFFGRRQLPSAPRSRCVAHRARDDDCHRSLAMSVLAHQLPPAAVTLVDGLRLIRDRRRGSPAPSTCCRILRPEPRHPAPSAAGRAHAQIDGSRLTSAPSTTPHQPFAAGLARPRRPARRNHPMVPPMNTGAEAVETTIKATRKSGLQGQGVRRTTPTMIMAARQLHVARDDDRVVLRRPERARSPSWPVARPASRSVRTGPSTRCSMAWTEPTITMLLEPIQGGPGAWLRQADFDLSGRARAGVRARRVLHQRRIHSAFGARHPLRLAAAGGAEPRPGDLGKALGGGMLPVAVVGRANVLGA